MVRSESAEEEMIVIDKYDMDGDDEDFTPQPIWSTARNTTGAPLRPVSRTASSISPTSADPDRRLRRQIANCNERRRMQSINAGFQSLRALLPRKEGEKLSKAAILQQTADLIHQLQSERSRYVEKEGAGGKKPKMEVSDLVEVDQRSMIDRLQVALERERTTRMFLEKQLSQMRELYAGCSPTSPTVPPPPSLTQLAHEASVIRPTPLPPITVDVTSRVTVSMPPAPSPLLTTVQCPSLQAPAPTLSTMTSTPSSFSSSLTAHRSLQTILDAIRHLEGGALVPPSPPPTSQAPLVR